MMDPLLQSFLPDLPGESIQDMEDDMPFGTDLLLSIGPLKP